MNEPFQNEDGARLQIFEEDCIRYAMTSALILGSERRSLEDVGWIGEQRTGANHVVAFSLAPIEVRFSDHASTLLAPTTAAFAKPSSVYVRKPRSERGQRTIFIAFGKDLAIQACTAVGHIPENASDVFPTRVGPASERALAMAIQLERLVFEDSPYIDWLAFEEYSFQIVELALEFGCNPGTFCKPSARQREQRKLVDDALDLICNNPARKWGLSELADQVDLTPPYLSRIFRNQVGRTMSQCLMLVRVIGAMEQLKDRSGDLMSLALESGFSSHSHMTAAFTSLLGVPPSTIAAGSAKSIHTTIRNLSRQLGEFHDRIS